MPWCPKCRNEYRDGFTVCSDCGTPLVSELSKTVIKPLCHFNNDEAYVKFTKYLNHLALKPSTVVKDELDYIGFDRNSFDDARKALIAFARVEGNINLIKQIDSSYIVEMIDMNEVYKEGEKIKEIADNMGEATDETTEDDPEEEFDTVKELVYGTKSQVYESKKNKAEEMSGSGYMLIILGICGAVFVVLHMLGLLSILNTQLFSLIMMLFIFVAMTYWGFHSLKKSKEYEADAVEEEKLTGYIKEWLKQNISAEDIKSADLPENVPEENFLLRTEYIKKRLTGEVKELKALDDVYLDSLVEDYYNSIFGE